jgi:hypothetical protein
VPVAPPLTPGEEALKQLYLSLSDFPDIFPDISKIRTGVIWIQVLRYWINGDE